MRIVHFADLHLDSAFAWCGASGDAARRRRQALREVLLAIVDITREVDADALFCGGDLYEHDRVMPDTAQFLRQTLASLDPIPVYVAPGNHDWYGPQSVYAAEEWSRNVHIFREPRLTPERLGQGVTLWGAAHCEPANTGNFLRQFRAEGPGIHLALFHGAERSSLADQESGKQPHAPFDATDIERTGLHHAFLGHYHRPRDAARHTYPGNPDPLQFGEDGVRGLVIVTVHPDGTVDRQRRSVSLTRAHDLVLDITGYATQQEIRKALAERARGLQGVVRLTLKGEIEPTLDLQESALKDVMNRFFDAVQIHTGDLYPGYDIGLIRQESTVRGQFVNDVLNEGLTPEQERRILTTGLRAFDGRDDLEAL